MADATDLRLAGVSRASEGSTWKAHDHAPDGKLYGLEPGVLIEMEDERGTVILRLGNINEPSPRSFGGGVTGSHFGGPVAPSCLLPKIQRGVVVAARAAQPVSSDILDDQRSWSLPSSATRVSIMLSGGNEMGRSLHRGAGGAIRRTPSRWNSIIVCSGWFICGMFRMLSGIGVFEKSTSTLPPTTVVAPELLSINSRTQVPSESNSKTRILPRCSPLQPPTRSW